MNATPTSIRSFHKNHPLLGPDSPTAITTIISLPSMEAEPVSADGAEERPRGWIFLLAFSGALMLVVWSLFSGSGPTAKVPLSSPAPGQATSFEASLATLLIEAEPADARIQVASVSLGTTVTEIGRLSVGVPEGESLAITVSLDGYQTVQTSLPSSNGKHVVQLKPISSLLKESAPARSAGKAKPSRPPQSTPEPSDCLD